MGKLKVHKKQNVKGVGGYGQILLLVYGFKRKNESENVTTYGHCDGQELA